MKIYLKILLVLMIVCIFCACAFSEEAAEEITKECSITSKKSGVYKMWDGDAKEYWTSRSGYSVIEIKIPDDRTAGGILIEWFSPFERFDVSEYAQDSALIRGLDQAVDKGGVAQFHAHLKFDVFIRLHHAEHFIQKRHPERLRFLLFVASALPIGSKFLCSRPLFHFRHGSTSCRV